MKRNIVLLLSSVILCACSLNKAPEGVVECVIKTSEGSITVAVFPDKAPKSAAAFLAIVDKGLYKRSSFYRVLNDANQPSNAPKAELLQGGLWSRTKKRPEVPRVEHETTQQTGLRHLAGTLSLAREQPGSASSEFFICIADQPGLDYGGENNPDGQGYAAFGKVIGGMDVMRKIYNKPENDQYFDPPILIIDIVKR
ncbi:peptidylprolyl isomerase [Flavihumibacter sp. ZG627]|uniref:peptidylprolyl isomerase n=1 Tax=Flavihumibacter sp. ZG627 TaxID=1463156 RepID=UPI00058042E8|nr:peptidylprolyl isomerase [Flavihumibacter sp. ZG627]KIC89589.1 peptidylprolyl isomerase [Flavihumibacter sp. ZG627]